MPEIIYRDPVTGQTIPRTGGGGGGGITRVIEVIIAGGSFTAPSEPLTDYVYICAAAAAIPFYLPPTATGTTNRYTVKRTGAGTVSVGISGGGIIDGSGSSQFFLSQWQSADFILRPGSNEWLVV